MLSQQPVPMQQRISMSLRAAARRVAVQPMAAARSVSVFAAHSAPAGLPRSPLLAARAELFETRSFRTFAALNEEAASAPRADVDRTNQLFVGNLPFTVDAQQLATLFADYSVTDTKIVYDQATGRSKGIAFVTFETSEEASKAQATVNGSELNGRNVRVESRTPPGERKPYEPRAPREFAPRRPQVNDERKLFVGNLAWAVDGLDLEDIFKEFGTVESAQVINDRETGRSRGFGFVVMATKEESAAAASELSGANIDGRKIIVEFASEKAKTE